MISQYEGQLPESAAPHRKSSTALLGRVGWGMLWAAVALWCVTSLILIYGGAPNDTGWGLLCAFVVLISVGLTLIAAGGPIARALLRWQLSRKGPLLLPADATWVEHWEELMHCSVR